MKRFEFPIHGVAAPGARILCESPLTEVWYQVRRYGTPEYCDYRSPEDESTPDSEAVKDYVIPRVLQAIELRAPMDRATILTKPLLVYYSLLNLVRAMITLSTGRVCEPHHGLSARGTCSSLTELSAKATKRGTLIELLRLYDVAPPSQPIHFHDVLRSVPELRSALSVPGHTSDVSVVQVAATSRGKVSLNFPQKTMSEQEFETSWSKSFPRLAQAFDYVGGYDLVLKQGLLPLCEDLDRYAQQVGEFCDQHLEVNLIDPARWYVVSSCNPHAGWPREARYLAALFMLSHCVRYQPELLYRESVANSYEHTLVDSLIRMADRFVPQMLLGWTGTKHFFGS